MLDLGQPRRRWTAAEKWQVALGAMGVLTTIIGCAIQFTQGS
ncbi:hypothetical protein OG292_19830 [Streptomyces sp. NBC_01511]